MKKWKEHFTAWFVDNTALGLESREVTYAGTCVFRHKCFPVGQQQSLEQDMVRALTTAA